MQKTEYPGVAQAVRQGTQRRRWKVLVQIMACMVVFCTAYMLILPALTMEKTASCGLEEHTHSESCYTKAEAETTALCVCSYESLGVHVHSDSCRDGEGNLVCGYADFVVHEHSGACYNGEGELICELPEIEAHTHTDACYKTVAAETEAAHIHGEECYVLERGELLCTLTEAEGHTHGESCYTQGELLCTLTEEDGHTHSEECYGESILSCTLDEIEGHAHTDACYEQIKTLVCTLEEGAAPEPTEAETVLVCTKEEILLHTHSDACYETFLDSNGEEQKRLICGCVEIKEHVHSDACMAVETAAGDADTLTCTLEESESHTHSALCYGTWTLTCEIPEHTHTDACYPEPVYYCGTEEHAHGESCYDEAGALICTLPEHAHSEECTQEAVYYCGTEEHAHGEGCYDEAGALICTLPEHAHSEECTQEAVYYCGMEEHAHGESCYDEAGTLICTLAEHAHDDTCLVDPTVCACGLKLHTHTEECKDAEGNLICTLEEHAATPLCGLDLSSLTEAEQETLKAVILQIHALPTAEEFEAKMLEYEDAGDLDGQDVYYIAIAEQATAAYELYTALSDAQKALIPNLEKLMAFSYMWEVMQLDAASYASSTITGYNLDANNILPIDGFLGTEAAYRYDGTTLGTYHGATKNILDKANVIYVDLPTRSDGARCSLGNYLLGTSHQTHLANGGVQGVFGVDLYSEFCALRVEEAATEYPGYIVKQVSYHDSDKTRIGRLSVTTDKGFILLIRSSFIEEEGLYIPAEEGAYLHLNLELLRKTKGWTNFEADPGYLPGSHTSDAAYVPVAYATLSPVSLYNAAGQVVGSAAAGSKDKATVSNIDFKLFDYSNYINKRSVTDADSTTKGDIHSSYRALANYFYFRGGIDPHADRDYSLDVSKYTPNINTVAQDGSGHGTYDQDGYTKYHARVEPKLWNGYPMLDFSTDANGDAITAPSGWETGAMFNPRSLRFLFDEEYANSQWDSGSRHAIAPGAVTQYDANNTPLQFDASTHTYWYDSAKNAVDYDTENNMFRVRPYTERISITADWPFADSSSSGDFLPFNYSNGIVNATYHSGGGWAQYPLSDSSFRMNDVNYWFGMSMEYTFMQGKDGTVTYTDDQGRVKTDVMDFAFSGDDDVWVFVDGVRILDLGGTHGSVTGTINFQTGEVKQYLDWGTDAQSFPTTLKECFALAGETPNGGWDDDGTGTPGDRFADYSIHTLQFYYLERGTAVANCSIRFNLPSYDDPLIIGKTVEAGNESPDQDVLEYVQENISYSYRVVEADENGKPTNTLLISEGQNYTLLENGADMGTGTVGAGGIFKLKHGQQAVFENLLAIAGNRSVDFVVEELLPESQKDHYKAVLYEMGVENNTAILNGEGNVENFIGYYGPVINTGNPTRIEYCNVVDTDTFGKLQISKQVTEGSAFAEDAAFTVRVMLDGEYVAGGTAYTVGETEHTVGDNGAITLKAGETALLKLPIPAGTAYTVMEDTEEGWVVTYAGTVTDSEGNETAQDLNDSKADTVPLGGTAHVTVTNSTYASRTVLSFSKQALGNTEDATFTFRIVQVDENGTAAAEKTGIWDENPTVTVSGETGSGTEVLFSYGGTAQPGVYYYKLTEVPAEGWVNDGSVYIVAITVTADKAEVTSVTKDGADYGTETVPAFLNYKATSVTVDKTVVGNFTDADKTREFSFTALVTLGEETVKPEPGEGYTVADDGTVSFTLAHGNSVTINGIPFGAVVTVTETETEGFSVYHTFNDSAQKYTSNTASVPASETVHFFNSGGYALPDTGGSGTTPYTTAGLVLILGSLAYLMYKRYAKRREEL